MFKPYPMKKILSALFVCFALGGFSQVSFEQKSKVILLDANFGIYNTVGSDSTQRATGKSKSDKAAPYGFALGFEYGALNWLGIGLRGQLCTYLTQKDSATGATPVAKAKDIMVVVNAHLLRKKRADILLGFDFGYSGFTFNSNDPKLHGAAKGGGLIYDLHLQPRVYFGEHFGMFLNIAYVSYSYPKLKIHDDERKYTDHLKFTASGINVALGLQIKF